MRELWSHQSQLQLGTKGQRYVPQEARIGIELVLFYSFFSSLSLSLARKRGIGSSTKQGKWDAIGCIALWLYFEAFQRPFRFFLPNNSTMPLWKRIQYIYACRSVKSSKPLHCTVCTYNTYIHTHIQNLNIYIYI